MWRRPHRQFSIRVVTVATTLLCVQLAIGAQPESRQTQFFEERIRPLLEKYCVACHSAKRADGNLRVDSRRALLVGGSRGAALVPGRPQDSLILDVFRRRGNVCRSFETEILNRQVNALTDWIETGAPWPQQGKSSLPQRTSRDGASEFWSFAPIRFPALPDVGFAQWCQQPVDRFILDRLDTVGLAAAARADKRTLIRRASFDLNGLPPPPDVVTRFLQDDSPDAFARIVDRYLASPTYGERWGRHWLDVVRYADARDLIQLPAGSDFREIWRYRDWVVRAFNADMSYRDFIQYQIAGDLLRASDSDSVGKDGLIATGMLALADFVPGDVDKDLMVADYVDDMINVVGQGIIGLTLACARCHEHKFDPISTEDYYALAGIFFSTSLVDDIPGNPGNTPLVRTELLTRRERQRIDERIARRRQPLREIEQQIADIRVQSSVFEVLTITWGEAGVTLHRNGRFAGANPEIKSISRDPNINNLMIGEAGSGKSVKFRGLLAELRVYGRQLSEHERLAVEATLMAEWFSHSASGDAKAATGIDDLWLHFRADDPEITNASDGSITAWPDRAGREKTARTMPGVSGPRQVNVAINRQPKKVLEFRGQESLFAPQTSPLVGSLFLVYGRSGIAQGGERILGWEDSRGGSHGLGLQPEGQNAMRAILRNRGKSGDLLSNHAFPFSEQIGDAAISAKRKELTARLDQLEKRRKEASDAFDKLPKLEIPQAISVRDGGPFGTRYAGFQDSPVFLRGDHKDLGPRVRRRFPEAVRVSNPPQITSGSGRLELSKWLTRGDHPLTARVIVNRLWQHHFGDGIVRTTNNFGGLGERPTHPLLLDHLAFDLMRADWSLKAVHRRIMNSSAYQQQSAANPRGLAEDPENRLLWRMNRRRLEAEAIRDALLAVSGTLDGRMGGPAFKNLTTPRRTLYLMTTRTGAETSNYGALFDRADNNSIVGKRTPSVVAPQALFMMNDPFVMAQAVFLSARLKEEIAADRPQERIHRLYQIVLGRFATERELEIGRDVIERDTKRGWVRLCLVLLCTNEFIYLG